MKNATIIILAHIDNGTTGGVIPGTGWTLADALSAAAARSLDDNRFGEPDFFAEILARHGDETRVPLYPASDELEAAGVDLVALNNAASNGLDMQVFGQALASGLALVEVNHLVNTYEGDDLTGMLQNFVEAVADDNACPDGNLRSYRRALATV